MKTIPSTDFRRDQSKRPEPAKAGDLFYHNYGFDPITSFERWDWSSTFGCWSALVTFSDGWRGYTYPCKLVNI